jgi:hypothetical protein
MSGDCKREGGWLAESPSGEIILLGAVRMWSEQMDMVLRAMPRLINSAKGELVSRHS